MSRVHKVRKQLKAKALITFVAMIVVAIGSWALTTSLLTQGQVEVPPEVIAGQEAQHLAWCDKIYHQNVGCPKQGQVKIPQAVLEEQEAQHLAWCDKIYHQNVGCPKHR